MNIFQARALPWRKMVEDLRFIGNPRVANALGNVRVSKCMQEIRTVCFEGSRSTTAAVLLPTGMK